MGSQSGTVTNGKGIQVGAEREHPQERPYPFLADVLPEQVWTAESDGKLDFVNQRMLDYSGHSFEEMIGTGWQQILHPDDRPRCLECWNHVLETGEDYEIEVRLRRADGAYRWHIARAQAQHDAEGDVVRWFGCNTDIDDQRRAEAEVLRLHREEAAREEAEAAQEKITNILNSITDAFFALDRKGRFTYVNRKAETLWDKRREDLLGKKIWRVFPEAIGSVPYEKISRAAAERETISFEAKSPILERWVEVHVYPAEDGVSVYFQDISERERAKEALRQSEVQFRGTFEQAAVGMAHVAPDGTWLRTNQKLADILGYSREELLQLSYQHLTHPDDLTDSRHVVQRLLQGSVQTASFEKRYLRKDGSVIWANVTTTLNRDPAGDPEYLISVIEDVTGRKQIEDALLESEEFNRQIIASSPDCIKVLTLDGELVSMNEHGLEALEIEDTCRFTGTSWSNFWEGADREEAGTALEIARTGGTRQFQGYRPTMTGTPKWWDVVVTPIMNAAGEPKQLLAVSRDITDLKQSEEALRKAKEKAEAANRAKSTFLANMSHEIRTPLTSIVGFTSFLAQQLSGKQLKYVEMIERSGKRLLDTLNALLMLARLEAKGMEIDFEDVNVADEVERVVQLFQPSADDKDLTLEHIVDTGARPPCASLDAGALNSILQNLISNAVKFTDDGRVTVTTQVAEHSFSSNNDAGAVPAVRVCVEDTGNGIDGDFLKRIFESFEQESSGFGRSHEGSGLGLSITRQLVELMSGAISVESEKGEGSAFTVAFPLVIEGEAASRADEAEKSHMMPPDARILVVEDQEEASLLVRDILDDAGEVVMTETGAGAIDAARATPFDLVLVDVNLGTVESGIDVLHALRAMPAYDEVPIVAVTAYALPGDREDFLKEGFDAYLSKPFMADELIELASRLLRR